MDGHVVVTMLHCMNVCICNEYGYHHSLTAYAFDQEGSLQSCQFYTCIIIVYKYQALFQSDHYTSIIFLHAHIYFSGQKFTKLKIKIRHILLLNYINCFKKLSWYAHNLNLSHCTRSVVTYCLHVARLQLELALWR